MLKEVTVYYNYPVHKSKQQHIETILRLSKEDKEKNLPAFEAVNIDRKEVNNYLKAFLNCAQIYKFQQNLRRQAIIERVNGNGETK